MPTKPSPEPWRAHGRESHEARDMAESFGTDAARYDRARPRYPEPLIHRIVTASPGPDVLDVGCGTGIAARQFQAAGCKVLGVDPDARMAEVAGRLGVEVEVSTFEAWEPAGREFDAVIAGQAWHWVDPVAGAAKAAAVLRPGGVLSAFWHVFQLPRELAAALAEVCERVMPDAPVDFRSTLNRSALDVYQSQFTKTADAMRESGAFGEPEQWRYDWEWTYTRDEWLDQTPTQGVFTRLGPEQLAEVLEGAGTAIDAMGGSLRMPYATVAVTGRLDHGRGA